MPPLLREVAEGQRDLIPLSLRSFPLTKGDYFLRRIAPQNDVFALHLMDKISTRISF